MGGEMARYLIVDSRDLTEYTGARFIQKAAGQLQSAGNEVTLFLIENGVIAARKGSDLGAEIAALARGGVRVVVDDVSCSARSITQFADGVASSNIDHLADLIVEGSDKVLWY